MQKTRYKNGFTLVEVLIALMLIGLAVASLVASNSAFTKANGTGTDLSTAEFLIEQIKELNALLPVTEPNSDTWTFGPEAGEVLVTYDDLDDFDDMKFSPPINANRVALNDLAAYSQHISVENVNASNFEKVEVDTTSSFVRVTVRVLLNSNEVCSTSWLRALY